MYNSVLKNNFDFASLLMNLLVLVPLLLTFPVITRTGEDVEDYLNHLCNLIAICSFASWTCLCFICTLFFKLYILSWVGSKYLKHWKSSSRALYFNFIECISHREIKIEGACQPKSVRIASAQAAYNVVFTLGQKGKSCIYKKNQ